MAAGDIISSARITSIMRRINSIENEWASNTSNLISLLSGSSDGNGQITWIHHEGDFVYCVGTYYDSGTRYSIFKVNDSSGAVTPLVEHGTGSGDVNSIGGVGMGNGVIWIADDDGTDERLQAFDTSGSLLNTITAASGTRYGASSGVGSNFIAVKEDSNSTAFVTKISGASLRELGVVKVNVGASSEVQVLPQSQPPSLPTLPGTYTIKMLTRYGDNWATFTDYEDDNSAPSTDELRVYDDNGNLVSTPTGFDSNTITMHFFSDHILFSTTSAGNQDGKAYVINGSTLTDIGLDFDADLGFTESASVLDRQYIGDTYGNIYSLRGSVFQDQIDKWSGQASSECTTFYYYPTPGSDTGKVSLGTPDYGISVPADDAVQDTLIHLLHLTACRNALEAACVNYKDPATGATYTTGVGSNNIFTVAIDSGQSDWTTPGVTYGDEVTDEHWNDIELVLDQLEISELA